MNYQKLYISFFIALICSVFPVNGQIDPCITKLQSADQKYEAGLFDEAILILKDVLANCNLSKNDKFTAHRILLLANLDIDELENAENSANTIMKLNPNYEPDKLRERADYIAIFSKYKPTPIFNIGIQFGLNSNQINTIKTYSILYDNDAEELANYESQLGFQVGLNAQYKMYKSFWIELGGQFRSSTYLNTLFNIENTTINYSETLNYLDFPLSGKYYFLSSKFRPFISLGIQASFLNSALGELSREEFSDIVNRKIQRNQFNLGYFGGLGLSYTSKSLNYQLGARYVAFPGQLNKSGTRYENISTVFKYYYIDNDFGMNLFEVFLSVGYSIKYKNL